MDTGKSLYNIYTSWTLKLSWKIISKSTLYQFPNLGVHIRSKTSSNLPNLTKYTDYFLVLREAHGGERDDGRRGAADGAPAGRARRAAAGLLIFDKDAEIAWCCADSTVLISVSTQRCRSPCLLNGADLRVHSTCADPRSAMPMPWSGGRSECTSL